MPGAGSPVQAPAPAPPKPKAPIPDQYKPLVSAIDGAIERGMQVNNAVCRVYSHMYVYVGVCMCIV